MLILVLAVVFIAGAVLALRIHDLRTALDDAEQELLNLRHALGTGESRLAAMRDELLHARRTAPAAAPADDKSTDKATP